MSETTPPSDGGESTSAPSNTPVVEVEIVEADVEVEIVEADSASQETASAHGAALPAQEAVGFVEEGGDGGGFDWPADPDEALAAALEQLRLSREEAVDLRDKLQRMTADFDNYRKRVERDQFDMTRRAGERVIVQLLPTLDAFDAALAFSPTTDGEKKLLDGMASTHSQLMDMLSKEGLETTPGAGVDFDPKIHEAVAGPADGSDDLTVSQELRRGYTLHDRVVRPALVAVDKLPS